MAALVRHPDSRGEAVRGIRVDVQREPALMRVSYRISGELERLRVPASRIPRFADGLWRHTCCEIFIARSGAAGYHEFNLSPSGEWAVYAFTSYREGAPLHGAEWNPAIRIGRRPGALQLDASIRCDPGNVALGISAVMEEQDGSISYWALRHPAGRPDFHHRDAFALELA